MCDYNKIFKELAEYTRIKEQTQAIIDSLQDELKQYMLDNNTDEIIGNEHKCSWKMVHGSKLDSKQLKVVYPELVQQYTVDNNYKRFVFK